MITRWRELLPPALLLGGIVGLLLGMAVGAHYLGAGFPWMLVDALAREVTAAVAAALLFLLLLVPIERLLVRRLRPIAATAVAAEVAGAPILAAAGYRLNRALGIRPQELFTAYALPPNLVLIVAAAVLLGLAAWWFTRLRVPSSGGLRPGRGTTVAVVALAIVLQGAVRLGARGTDDGGRPDVLILLVDALRADHLSSYGYSRPTTPALDALAADAVRFEQVIASSTFTKSSIASLLTGRHPYQHGVYWGSLERGSGVTADLLPPSETTLAEVLRDHGYLTAAWVQNSHLREFMGFGQGFVDYHDQQGGIERIHRRFGRFLRGPGPRHPFFAYLHYIDLHDPYLPEPPYDTMFGGDRRVYDGIDLAEWGAYLKAVREGREVPSADELAQLRGLYDGQLRYVDEQIGRLLAQLRERGIYDDSLIVVTSDHGDAFYEHGAISHSTTPYEELVRVPLLVKLPGSRFAGRIVEPQVRLIDVLPTVLKGVGIESELPGVAGCALQPLMRAGPGAAPLDPACQVAVIEIAQGEEAPTVAVRTGGLKYIHDGSEIGELYDLVADPGERVDLAAERPEDAHRLRRLALDVVAARDAEPAQRLDLDERTVRELKALGYLD